MTDRMDDHDSGFAQHAYRLQRRGFHIFPTGGDDAKCPLVKWGTEATNELEQIILWFGTDGRRGIGVSCGPSGVVVVDVDAYKPDGVKSLRWLIENGYQLPPTLSAITPRGGAHYYYQAPPWELRNTAGCLPGVDVDLPGIDLRARGGYVVAPPTALGHGFRYEFLTNWPQQPAPCPTWLRPAPPRRTLHSPPETNKATLAYASAALRNEVDIVANTPESKRNDTLNRAAFNLGRFVADGTLERTTVEIALERAAAACGLQARPSQQTVASGLDSALGKAAL